jgi:hypothetical protein
MSGLSGARAADPGFCRQFAKAAVSQVRGALADPRCGAGVQAAAVTAGAMKNYATVLCHDRARGATLTFRYRDGSQLSEQPCQHVRLTGGLGRGFNHWRPTFG